MTNMCDAIVTMGNIFMDTSHEHMTLDTQNYADTMVVHTLHIIETLGKEQYCEYVNDMLVD